MTAKVHGQGGKPYGRSEFDKLLGNYGAVTDAPCANLAKELIAAYPEAKVVLNTRDPDTWLESMERSYFAVLNWMPWLILAKFEPQADVHFAFLRLVLTDLTGGYPNDRVRLRQGYLKHYDEIRSLVPPENLLEHRSRDGWGPLCEFLNRAVPNEPYPRVNEGDALFALHKKVFWFLLGSLFVTRILPLAVIVVGVWYGYFSKKKTVA